MGDRMCKQLLRKDISIRRLEIKDAKTMFEWMHDTNICRKMQNDFSKYNIEDCVDFIESSWNDRENFHYAITNSKDEYCGTVSLKNIDRKNSNAEFAIVLCQRAIGTAIATTALFHIMNNAFKFLKLHKVYLYVRADNKRAIAFYKKNNLTYEGRFKEHLYIDGNFKDIEWFSLTLEEYDQWIESYE